MIEQKISMISVEKIALQDLLKRANVEFPNDEKVIELCEKYRRLFKESIFVKDFKAHTDDFDNNDDDGGGKNEDHGSDNVGKKKESAAKDVVNAKKDGVNAEKDGVNDVQEGEAGVNEEPEDMLEEETFTHIVKPSAYLKYPYINKRTKVIPLIKRLEFVLGNSLFAMQGDKYETMFQTRSGHDLSSVHLNMETLAPRLWIDANDIDCWVAILNHEELVRGTIDKEQQWKVFLDEILAEFNHDVSSISLSEVDLAFFPICASGHFYVVVFHLKSPSAMIILDNSDCGETYNSKYKAVCEPLLKWNTTKNHSNYGVFTMIHLEHYFGKPVGQWDFGLCAKLDEQVSMLRRIRFKIAAKILLHELNVHAEKMFDLTFKFEAENNEQTRILIIVNTIKNRDERNPAKTKSLG
ncbi:ulp1 protease family, C-terminal catalytic domain-containing protein [Tanacetum coccineum]